MIPLPTDSTPTPPSPIPADGDWLHGLLFFLYTLRTKAYRNGSVYQVHIWYGMDMCVLLLLQ